MTAHVHKKSPRRKARAFHPLEWYYDSIGCWLGVKNPGLLFLDNNPLNRLLSGFRVHHFDAVDAWLWQVHPIVRINDIVYLADHSTCLIKHLDVHFLAIVGPADIDSAS